MKSLVYTATKKLEWLDSPQPQIGPGEALVRVKAVGVCGSDIHGWLGHIRGRVPPLVLGHEMAGIVEEIQDGGRVRVGQSVAVYPVAGCGACRYCTTDRDRLCARRHILGMHAPGGLAELLKAPAANLYPLPESMDEIAGALVEPLSNALHFVEYARNDPGAIAIFGAGAIGLLMLQVARQLKANGTRLFPRVAVAEINRRRAALALSLGADMVVDPTASDALAELQNFFGEDGCSAALDAAGFSASRRLAIQLVAPGGLVGLAGMGETETTVDCVDLIRREIRFAGIYGYGHEHFQRAIEWLAAGKVEYKSWISEALLAEGQRIFEELARPDPPYVKIIMRP